MKFILIALLLLFPSAQAAYKVPVNGVGTNNIKDSAVTTAKINNNAVTRQKLASVGQQKSLSCGSISISGTSYTDMTNLSVTITTTGRPVFVSLVADEGASVSRFYVSASSGGSIEVLLLRDSTTLYTYGANSGSTYLGNIMLPPYLDVVAAGTYTYKLQWRRAGVSTATGNAENLKLFAYEL